jgi:thymidylate synthase (FAD)
MFLLGQAMRVELKFVTPNALAQIGEYAGICYNSNLEEGTCIKRAISCKDKGHLATLRFAHATFHVSGISRTCSHQFVRSKHLDFLQRSQRYCKEDVAEFVVPYADKQCSEIMQKHFEWCQGTYKALLAYGMKKEDARFVLPEATATELIVVGNFQAWLDFIALRADKHAQWEIREVAKTINNILSEHAPGLFNWMP